MRILPPDSSIYRFSISARRYFVVYAPFRDVRKSTYLRRTHCISSPDSQCAEAFDALSQQWTFQMASFFPPLPLIPRVLSKLEPSVWSYIVVLPFWPNQTWHPRLQMLPVKDARRLPLLPNLVVDLTVDALPPNMASLHLVAWNVFEQISRN